MINLLDAFKNESKFTKKIFGQHFLTNQHILQEIVNATDVTSDDNVIEIGPGCGVLTQLFADTGAEVRAVEIDSELAEFLNRYLFFYKNLQIINHDALTVDFNSIFDNKEVIFVGNLPYNVSVKLFERAAFANNAKCLVFMFQKEVADRLAAKPNSKTYSSLSVFTSYMFDVKKVRDIGGGNFWPNAGVMSTVLKFIPKQVKLLSKDEEQPFFEFTRLAFKQKRKTLRNNLKSIDNIEEIIKSTGFKDSIRAEELSVEDFIKLYKAIYSN